MTRKSKAWSAGRTHNKGNITHQAWIGQGSLNNWWNAIPSRRNSMCKGSVMAKSMLYSRNIRRLMWPRIGWAKERTTQKNGSRRGKQGAKVRKILYTMLRFLNLSNESQIAREGTDDAVPILFQDNESWNLGHEKKSYLLSAMSQALWWEFDICL